MWVVNRYKQLNMYLKREIEHIVQLESLLYWHIRLKCVDVLVCIILTIINVFNFTIFCYLQEMDTRTVYGRRIMIKQLGSFPLTVSLRRVSKSGSQNFFERQLGGQRSVSRVRCVCVCVCMRFSGWKDTLKFLLPAFFFKGLSEDDTVCGWGWSWRCSRFKQ